MLPKIPSTTGTCHIVNRGRAFVTQLRCSFKRHHTNNHRITMGFASIFTLLGITNGIVNASFFVDPVNVYHVRIEPLASNSTTAPAATGFATIFTDRSKLLVGYAGIVSNLEPNLLASTCNATNGCGVHIHSGRSCDSTTTQGGHYFNNASVPIDPWIDERYSSDDKGKANFQSIVTMGTVDVEGRVFIGTYLDLDFKRKVTA